MDSPSAESKFRYSVDLAAHITVDSSSAVSKYCTALIVAAHITVDSSSAVSKFRTALVMESSNRGKLLFQIILWNIGNSYSSSTINHTYNAIERVSLMSIFDCLNSFEI